MNTPIYDFVNNYVQKEGVRLHMPGHKGRGMLGIEQYDITEIAGADVLYFAEGIIDESENNLSALYGTGHSFYSTEGSTLAIKAMLYLVSQRNSGEGRPLILAARNVHSSFVRAAALLDLDVRWIYPEDSEHICSSKIDASDLRCEILSSPIPPSAVYLTSPDYLGFMLDIASLSEVCREFDIPLLVDNAHGAYLKFLAEDRHPISLGAAMCADSAHKTLPALTGGAYLHISKDYPEFSAVAREALSLFASTSPSYLTLLSLDLLNRRIYDGYGKKILRAADECRSLKEKIASLGYDILPGEELKIVIKEGERLSRHLRKRGIEVEFSDRDYTVLMLSAENTPEELSRLLSALSDFSPERSNTSPPVPKRHTALMTVREAILSPKENVPVELAEGRISGAPSISCPPAVPIVISGERITAEDVELLKYYNINKISCVIE